MNIGSFFGRILKPSRSRPQRSYRRRLRLEDLESRQLLTVVMTDHEQLLLELVNRARSDPAAEAARYDIDLNEGLAAGTISSEAKEPLAPNQSLINAAGLHSEDMLANDYFSHTNMSGEGSADRIFAAGYTGVSTGENISVGGSTGPIDQTENVYERHQNLFKSPGHRTNILRERFDELGNGVRFGVYTPDGNNYNVGMVTENFGGSDGKTFITGVAFDDSVLENDFFEVGESAADVLVRAVSAAATFETTTGPSGGYSLEVPHGTYDVIFSGGGHTGQVEFEDMVVSGANIKVDLDTADATWTDPTPQLEDGIVSLQGNGKVIWTPLDGSEPRLVGSGMSDLFQDSQDNYVALGRDSVVYHLQNDLSWVVVGNNVSSMVQDQSNRLIALRTNNLVYELLPDMTWSAAADVEIEKIFRDSQGRVIAFGVDDVVYQLTAPLDWQSLRSDMVELYQDNAGNLVSLGGNRVVYQLLSDLSWRSRVGTGMNAMLQDALGRIVTHGSDKIVYELSTSLTWSVGPAMERIACDNNGRIIGLSSSGTVAERVSGQTWQTLGTGMAKLLRNGDGNIVTLGNDDLVYLLNSDLTWTVGPSMKTLVIHRDGRIIGLGPDGVVYDLTSIQSPHSIGSGVVELLQNNDGDIVSLGEDRVVSELLSDLTWRRRVGTGMNAMVQNHSGQIYTLGSDNVVYALSDHLTWSAVGDSKRRIVSNNNGQIISLGENSRVYSLASDGTWQLLGTGMIDLFRDNSGNIVTLGSDKIVYQLRANLTWRSRVGTGMQALVQARTGEIFALGNDSIVYELLTSLTWRSNVANNMAQLYRTTSGVYTLSHGGVTYKLQPDKSFAPA